MKLSIYILLAVALGVLAGVYLAGSISLDLVDSAISIALATVLFGVGIDLGANDKAWKELATLGFRIVLVPIVVAIASLISCALVGLALGLSVREGLAVGAGFGWYSLSAGLISKLYSPIIGALALLTNVFREVIAIISVPLVAKYLGDIAAVAPGGATSMDTSLPIIAKATGGRATSVAFITGAVLSALVPLLVPLILKW